MKNEGVKTLIKDREKRYGRFNRQAEIAQYLKDIMRDSPNWNILSPDKKEALDMIQHKIARVLNGDPEWQDSWDDIIGYTMRVVEYLKGE
jgi:hypothetical protein